MKKLPGQARRRVSAGARSSGSQGSITDVPGISAGHADDQEARTGCTVVLCGDEGAVAGVDVRGSAPGTRETDLLEPGSLVERVHAVVLSGGSAFGLDAACGVMRFLEERGVGFDARVARVPIVPAAVIFDLAVGDASTRPDARMGYCACENASRAPLREGQVGVGAGASIGKLLGPGNASPGGVGTASAKIPGGACVGALVVVNAFGDVVDPETGRILAGARSPNGRGWLDIARTLAEGPALSPTVEPAASHPSGIESTTLAIIATDAALTKPQARKVASMAHDGMARSIRPIHTMFDGDTIFALSTGGIEADITTIGTVAAGLVATAIARAARAAITRR
ncbi:MAG TPA: P1 family peptidase [Blastocatellia bacterium]|nr:P1 family peptidase [Blastocatellia bacterium]